MSGWHVTLLVFQQPEVLSLWVTVPHNKHCVVVYERGTKMIVVYSRLGTGQVSWWHLTLPVFHQPKVFSLIVTVPHNKHCMVICERGTRWIIVYSRSVVGELRIGINHHRNWADTGHSLLESYLVAWWNCYIPGASCPSRSTFVGANLFLKKDYGV